jgi:hypothetical protein
VCSLICGICAICVRILVRREAGITQRHSAGIGLWRGCAHRDAAGDADPVDAALRVAHELD